MRVSTVLVVLCLLAASATIAHAQQVSCYNQLSCGGPATSLTARECCLSDSGLSYNDGNVCTMCIVFGWVQSTIVGNESSRDVQEAEIGYIKGNGNRIAVNLTFIDAPSGTPSARPTDVMITTPNPSIPPSAFPRFIFRMSFSADSIAQEGTERAILRLALADNSGAPVGGFLKSDLELVISDQDVIVIQFDQDDYANNEGDEEMPLSVTKNLILANPVSLQILPVTVDQAGSRLPANLPPDDRLSPNRAKITPEDRRDFSSNVLNLTFPADELVGNDMIVNQIRRTIVLVDDAIDEADVEFFVILLDVRGATDPSLINLRRNVALGRISDNDQITIGFEFESYTYTEPLFEMESGFNVFLVKENDVITEQIYPIVFRLSNSAPNNSIQVAAFGVDYDVNIDLDDGAEIEFPANQQRIQVFVQFFTFILFPDTSPEGTEAFQITTGPGTRPRYIIPAANSEVFANSFMIILDDDIITIGWVNTSFTVREDIGTFEACYRVFLPIPEDPLDQPIIMLVDTRAGTAGDNDYVPLVAGQEMFVNNANRERCVTITIEDDNVFEETEQFSIELSESSFSSVNPQVIPNLANITIVDTTNLTIGFIGAPYRVGEDMGPMEFTVGIIGDTTLADGVEVVVSFSTLQQAPSGREIAIDGSDYVGRSNVLLTFNSATSAIQVPVNLIDDSVFEMEEDFTGTLTLISSSVGAERVSIGPQTAIATIVDNEIVCQELDALVNGRIEYSPDMTAPYDEGTVATHICNTGFALVGNVIRTCRNDSLFNENPPTCEPIECELLPPIVNGNIIYAPDNAANYELGTIATYNCDANFFLDLSGGGSQTRECIDDGDGDVLGEFNRQAPRCVPIECEPLPGIPNGSITYEEDMVPNYEIGTVATYMCDDGFILDGEDQRNCTAGDGSSAIGVFNGMAPTCVPIECEPLPSIANGVITYAPDNTPNYALGTNATYACNAGFVLDLSGGGSEMRTCRDDFDNDALGEFDRQAPICVPIECEPLPSIANGVIIYSPDNTPNYALGTVATYECNTGFVLDLSVGSQTRTCGDDGDGDALGEFDGQAPSCVPIECEPLPSIANGFITYAPDNTPNYALGTVATYECNTGFVLDLSVGSRTRTCGDDGDNDALGEFDGQAPSCVPIECEPLPSIANGFITYAPDNTPNYALNTVATYACNAGFVLDLSGGGSEMRECLDDGDGDALGEFDRQAPTCIPIECEPLPSIANGVIIYSPDNTPNYALGTVATYECNTGFVLDLSGGGSQTRTCGDDGDGDALGEFSGQAPSCVPIECEPLPSIANGFITYAPDNTPNYALNTVATYACNAGFVLDLSGGGSEMRTCLDDGDNDALGEFDRQAPTCIPIECEPLPSITNGVITYSPDNTPNYELGTNATYTCNAGFTLDLSGGGTQIRECIDDGDGDARGVFNGQAPTCTFVNVVRVNDTVIGDPLMTVPLYVQNKSAIMPLGEKDNVHLCFEVHGQSDAYFNLVSDNCVSVNAHYRQIRPNEDINIIDNIAIRAVGSDGVCHNIDVSLDQCTARMDGMVISSFSAAGISVRTFPSRVRITVPNCGSVNGLVMWVMCQTQTFWSTSQVDSAGNEVTFQDEAIRFVVARGLNLRQTSHGILGQFWNIPIEVVPYNGPFIEAPEPGIATYSVNINYPGVTPRSFVAWLRFPSWELERRMYCLYAGDGHAGSVYEVPEGPSNGPVIEGVYTDYIIAEQFGTDFTYSHFESARC